MSTISKPHTFSPNTTISSSQMNSNFDTLYNDYNGGINASNLASSSVSTAKIADSAVTTDKINDGAVTNEKLSSEAGFVEMGRQTLSSASDTISVTGLPARRYLQVQVLTIGSGTITQLMRFNNISTNTYAYRSSVNGGSDSTTTSTSGIQFTSGDSNNTSFIVMDIENRTTSEKIVHAHTSLGAAGAGNAPVRVETAAKWVNTSDQITRIDIINTNTGDFASGSEIIVLGHD